MNAKVFLWIFLYKLLKKVESIQKFDSIYIKPTIQNSQDYDR